MLRFLGKISVLTSILHTKMSNAYFRLNSKEKLLRKQNVRKKKMSREKIGIGGSCHWCTEAIFQSLVGVEEVLQGWIHSDGKATPFSEAVLITFDSDIIALETLIEIHLHTHSCTSVHSMREKYRSAIYFFNEEQKDRAIDALSVLQKDFSDVIITQVLPFVAFKLNIEDQLNYYQSNPEKPFCENYINPKLKLVLEKFSKSANHKKLDHLKTSVIGLGTAAIGRPVYINVNESKTDLSENFDLEHYKQQGLDFLKEAIALGVTYFDSSPGYGVAEDMLIELTKDKSLNDIQIATKWGYTYVANFDFKATVHEQKEHSIATLNRQWEKSKKLLPNLRLYQIHSVTPDSKVLNDNDVIQRLYELKKENNIQIGLSTSGVEQIEVIKKALLIEIEGKPLFTSFQVTFNVLDQSLLTISDWIADKNIIIKEALANGRILSETFTNYRETQKILTQLAQKYNVTNDAIALRYCMDSFKGCKVLSGANNTMHLKQNLKANTFQLSKEEMEQLKSLASNATAYWEERKKLKWN